MNSNHLHSPFAVQWSVWETAMADDNKRGGEATQSRDERRDQRSAPERHGHWHQACCEGPTPCLAAWLLRRRFYHYVKGLLLNTAQMCLGNQRFNLLRKCLILQRIEICGWFMMNSCLRQSLSLSPNLSGVQFIGSALDLLASLFWRVSTKPAPIYLQNTRPRVSKGNRFLQSHAAPGGRAGPPLLPRCADCAAGPRTAQAIRLFQGYALIMEWAAYRDSRKADWEQIGRGKTSRKRCSVPAYLFNLSKWLER